ncbi:MAG: MFS transporter [Ardenticatenaceae bacterium]|nr:MFS transporter [Ardenticatenaceae bacterium]
MRHLTPDLRFMFLSVMLWGFGSSLFIYIQPLYVASLGASPAQIGTTLSVGSFLGLLLYIPIAQYADKIGRKRIIIAGWSLGVLATIGMAATPTWQWFIPATAVYQISSAAMPAFLGYIATHSRHDNPSPIFATIWSAAYIGSVLAPALGGWIGEQFGLRALYLSAAFMFALSTLAVSRIQSQPATPTTTKISPRQLWQNRPFMRQILYVFLLFFAIDIGQVLLPQYLEEIHHYSLSQIGQFGTIGSIGVILLSLLLGRIPGPPRIAIFLAQLGILLALILWLNTPLPLLIGAGYFIHGRNRLTQPFIDGRLARTFSPQEINLGYSFREIAMRLGLAVSPFTAGLLYAQQPTWPLYAGIICLLATILLTFLMPTPTTSPHWQTANNYP